MACGHPCNCPSYRDHVSSIHFGAGAFPTRKAEVARTEAKERVLAKDLVAYRNLRRNGVQPKSVDGSAHLERHASERVEVETGRIAAEPKWAQRVADAHST